jgi:DNA replication licensing factor MCM4
MYPTEILQLIDMVCSLVAKENVRQEALTNANTLAHPEEDMQNVGLIQACPFNLSQTYKIRDLTPSHIDKYIQVSGIVIRNSDIVPEMNIAAFKCAKCGFIIQEQLDRNKTFEPQLCPNQECKARGTFELAHQHCSFTARQYVKLQETPESVPEGEAPQTM